MFTKKEIMIIDQSENIKGEQTEFRKVLKGILERGDFALEQFYNSRVIPELIQKFGYESFRVPKILKISINSGVGKISKNPKELQALRDKITVITGQKPRVTKAKSSVAGFNVREGMEVGLSVTLRGDKMYAFLCKLIHIVFPMILDFRGVTGGFDGFGNFNFGVTNVVFPELCYSGDLFGFDISIVTSASTDLEGSFLLESFGFPIV
jgi:large subunit ribosomal protein L5